MAQFFQVIDDFASRLAPFKLKKSSHPGKQSRIDPIGFCELARGFGKVACLARVDFYKGQARHRQGAFESAMIRTRRLEDHLRRLASDPGDQAFVVVFDCGELAACTARHAVSIESVFRDIHADGIRDHLFRASACHSGLSPEYPSRPKEKTRAITL